jgi:hypothetical protein
MYLTECQLNEDSNPSSSLSKFHAIADDLIGYVSYIKTKTKKKFYPCLAILNDHMMFEKYLVFF